MPVITALPDHSLILDNDVFTHLRKGDPAIVKLTNVYWSSLKSFPSLPSITIFEAIKGIEKALKKKEITRLL